MKNNLDYSDDINRKCTVLRDDRIGMQLYAIMNGIYYCKKNNLEYIHIPLDDIYIEYDKLFKLGHGYETMCKETFENEHQYQTGCIKNIGHLFSLIKKKNKEKERIKECNINYKSSIFRVYQSQLIAQYKNSELYKKMFSVNTINICIHYRRGDIINLNSKKYKDVRYVIKERYNLRYTPDNFINEIINKLNVHMANLPINIHIHSDSVLKLEKLIKVKHNFNVCPHFDESPLDALNSMIQCDILFRYGISAFSGIAAFYNTNTVISKIPPKYKRLYDFSNTYYFKKCDQILAHLATQFSNV